MAKIFGVTPLGETIYQYSLGKPDGFRVNIINYGAIITGIYTPDNKNQFKNVVLSYDSLEDYIDNPAYIGASIGRLAGRTPSALLKVDEQEYVLDRSNNAHYLHSSLHGLSHHVWHMHHHDEKKLILEIQDEYTGGKPPGNLKIQVEFTIDNDRELSIRYRAKTDLKTYINMTNHTYFNLSNDEVSIDKHDLYINASKFCSVDEALLPIYQRACQGIVDFKTSKKIVDIINQTHEQILVARGIDHPFILDDDNLKAVALNCPSSGRQMNICSNQPALVVYSGNYLSHAQVPSGKTFVDRQGICFEFQHIPNTPDHKGGLIYTTPDHDYDHKTTYTFF